MSADWSKPIATTLYTSVLTVIDERFDDVAKMFNGLSPTNLPTGAFRIDGTSDNLLQTWNGATWDNEKLSVQTLLIGADGNNAAATVTDLTLFGDANIAAQGNLNLYIDSNNDETDRKFNWYKNSNDTTGAVLLMSLSEAGVLAIVGTVTATTFTGALVGNASTATSATSAGTASTVTTNANLVGQVTSVGNTATLRISAITSQTLQSAAIVDGDEFLMSDAGVIKRSIFTRIYTYVVAKTIVAAHAWTANQTLNDNVLIRFGTSGAESNIYSDATNTIWNCGADKDIYVRDNGSNRFLFDTSVGDFHATGDLVASTAVFSDPRLKENIAPIHDALWKVNQLRGVTFNWKATEKPDAGLLSTDVEAVLPEAIKLKTVLAREDNDTEYQTVNYNATIGLLVEAIKELNDKVEQLA